MHRFALNQQRLPARHENVDSRRALQQTLDELCRCLDHMLAVIEDEQHP